ncbi:MAG: copper resistance protein NlpE [Bacteroidota bacterium]
MKTLQIFCLSALLGLAVGCKNEPETPSVEQKEQGTLPTVETDSVPKDSVAGAATTGQPAWAGNYSGSLPCGDCKGILTNITLNTDKTYSLSSQYIGKENKPNVYKGTYNLDDKNIVTLDAEGDHLKFLIMEPESMLKKLDKFGNDEQGGPEARYFLHKV